MPKKNIIANKKNTEKVSPEIISAAKTAKFYGFTKLLEIEVEKEDCRLSKKFQESHLKSIHPFTEKKDRFNGYLEEKICLIRKFMDRTLMPSKPLPIMAFYNGPIKGNPHIKKSFEEETFNLDIIGSSKPIIDATIIETSFIILKERYPKEDFIVEINSVGDKESLTRFGKELGNFIKKESPRLAKQCRESYNEEIWNIFSCEHTSCREVLLRAPHSMSFLSESSRSHFREVLEFLESLGIPYEINHALLGSRSYCSETIFEIRNASGSIFSIGERYNGLSRKVWGKKDIPAIGSALLIHPHFIERKQKKEKEERPKFYFVQLGFDAKLLSLRVLETLRQSNIPIEQSISKDKLSVQLSVAEKLGIPYIIIMGQKEAMEKTVVVRKISTMSQETIPIDSLCSYLKKLK